MYMYICDDKPDLSHYSDQKFFLLVYKLQIYLAAIVSRSIPRWIAKSFGKIVKVITRDNLLKFGTTMVNATKYIQYGHWRSIFVLLNENS